MGDEMHVHRAHLVGELPGYSPPPLPELPQNQNFKNTDFVHIMISKVLCDLPFSQNQPLKSADD
jgi:hypothetical protein